MISIIVEGRAGMKSNLVWADFNVIRMLGRLVLKILIERTSQRIKRFSAPRIKA